MEHLLTLYHGSERIIEEPTYGVGKLNNDFGLGFYCTESEDLAKEWAVSSLRSGFANRYTLDTEYLNVLNLNSPDYTILNWIAVLVEHRLFAIKTPVARRAKRYLIDHFGVNVNAFDLVTGHRADDSYFDYAESFLNNGITVQQLAQAMRLGKLGEQIVVKSKFAFSSLHYEGFDIAEKREILLLRKARDDDANRMYLEMLEKEDDGLYIQDIMRGASRTMIRAYQEIYLSNAQAALGEAFDYAVHDCGIPGEQFVKLFAASTISRRMENGEPDYLAGKSGIELVADILSETTGKVPKAASSEHFGRSREYWIGWAVAYYQWWSGRKYSEIFSAVPFEALQRLYTTLHEADTSKFVDILNTRIRETFPDTNLKRIRSNYGCTQAELARLSGVSLRSIQTYEQRKKDINKASAETLLALSKVLGCTMEDLIDR